MHLGVHAVATLTKGKESSVTITRTAVTRPTGFAFQLSVLRPNNSCLFFDITRFWVQHWVQLIEGRMAFPVRKRRQIGHLAFLLLWLRTRRSGVRVPRRGTLLSSFQSPRTRSVLKVGRLLGCIGCNNAAFGSSKPMPTFSTTPLRNVTSSLSLE